MRASERTPMSARTLGSVRADAGVSARTHVHVRADAGLHPHGRQCLP
jgi:hypothetical protein